MKRKISGIYCIENLMNGKKYVGQSIDCETRIKSHKYLLKKSKDNAYILQNAWNKYGEKNFTFYLLAECDTCNLDQLEDFFIELLKSHISEWGYNNRLCNDMRGSSNSFYNKSHSKESCEKMSNSQRKRFEDPKEREKLSLAKKGQKMSKEVCERMNKEKKNVPRKEETRQKISKTLTGKKRTGIFSSQYVGVAFDNKSKKWRARITYEGKRLNLGYFENEIDAAFAYNNTAIELFGEDAKINNIL